MLDKEVYDREGFVVCRQLISPRDALTMLGDALRAIRGEIFVPTWPEYVASRRGTDQAQTAVKSRTDSTFAQLARPSETEALQHWRAHPGYERALAGASVLCPFKGVSFSYDQCFYKPGGSTALVYPHQDGAYWGVKGITCWLALSEVATDMAPVQYFPRSHARPLPHVEAPRAWNDIRDLMVAPPALAKLPVPPVSAVLEPGDAVFHSSLTVHQSGPNASSRARCGLALHFKTVQPA